MTWGASESDWFALDVLQGLTADLLPVVSNPNAVISAQSKMKALGKTPSRYNGAREVAGIPKWTEYRATPRDIERWMVEPDYGICIQTREVRAIDIDVEDSDEILRFIRTAFPSLSLRYRVDSGKCLLFFRVAGEFSKRILPCKDGVVELLANGQQFVVAGTHPNGSPYLVEPALDTPLVSLSLSELNGLWAQLEQRFGTDPSTVERQSNRSTQIATAVQRDPVSQYLDTHGWTISRDRDGRSHIRCPWESEHTTESAESATTYFPPHTHGFAQGHFRCLHAHCSHRTDVEFLAAVGYADVEFDEIPLDAELESTFEKHLARIDDAVNDTELRERVCLGIQADKTLSDIDREQLAQVVKTRFASLGKPIPLKMCRGLVKEAKRIDTSHLPDWLRNWVYVKDRDKFFRLDSPEWATVQGFNAQYGKTAAQDADGGSPSALALSVYGIPVVQRQVYLPWAEPLFELDGATCANRFRPSTVPFASTVLTPQDEDAVRAVDTHLRLLCGNREAVYTALLNWIAHNVQNPGLKIRHAPLIYGIPGVGKSTVGQILSAVLGSENTREVAPGELKSSFNGFAEGCSIAILEEIRIDDKVNAHVADIVKPWITNDRIPIHRKGSDGYDVYNTTNYIAFTNHPDAIPLDAGDRRWFIIFSPFATIGDLAARVGDVSEYFDRLYDAIYKHPGALRRWLLDYEIPASWNRNKGAPITDERASMVELTAHDQSRSVEQIIEHGALGVARDVISTRHLTDALQAHGEIPARTRTLAKLLLRLGFVRLEGRVTWRGEQCTLWVRHAAAVSKVRAVELLDQTA